MTSVMSSILLLIFFLVVTGTGLFILKRFRIASVFSAGEMLFLGYATGAGIVGFGVFALASLQLLYPVWLASLLILALLLSIAGWRKFDLVAAIRSFCLPSSTIERFALILVCILLVASYLLALTPEIGKDALIYHLGVPKLYIENHGFYFIEGNVFSNLPFHTEMLFLVGLFMQGDILAKGMAFLALPLLLLGIGLFAGNRMGQNNYPYLSMLTFAMIPTVFDLSHTAYIDLYVSLYALAAIYAFIGWYECRERGWLVLSALFTGLAISCKYSALFFMFPAVLGVLWRYRKEDDARSALRDLFIFMAVAILVGMPFYLKNWLMTGNPLYPFMYRIFGGRGLDAELTRLFDILYKYMGMGRDWIDYLLLPWNISFRAAMNSSRFDGVIGPMFLLVLPFIVGMRKRMGNSLQLTVIFTVTFFLFWASSSQDIRYLSPLFPLFGLMTGAVFTFYRERYRTISAIIAASVLFGLSWNSRYIAHDFMRIRPIGVLMGTENREGFMSRSLSHYPMYSYINSTLPSDAKVYMLYMRHLTFLSERDFYSDTMYEHYTLQKMLAASSSPADFHQRLKSGGFTHLAFDRIYVTGSKSLLTPEQISLFKEFQQQYLTLLHTSWTNELYSMK